MYVYPCESCPSVVVDVNSREPYFCMAKKYHSGTVGGLFKGECPYGCGVTVVEC